MRARVGKASELQFAQRQARERIRVVGIEPHRFRQLARAFFGTAEDQQVEAVLLPRVGEIGTRRGGVAEEALRGAGRSRFGGDAAETQPRLDVFGARGIDALNRAQRAGKIAWVRLTGQVIECTSCRS